MNTLQEFEETIRTIPDFPKKGILFRDITPVLTHPDLCRRLIDLMAEPWMSKNIEAVAGIESRGFLFGMSLAGVLGVPFIPMRKVGKLPGDTYVTEYQLEYGTAKLEMHKEALGSHKNVLIHDDLLATGGTSKAAADLVHQAGANVIGFSYMIELSYFRGSTGVEEIAPIEYLLSF